MVAVEDTWIWGSPATTPVIQPWLSSSAAASAAPPPLETLAAMVRIFPVGNARTVLPLSFVPNFSFNM